MTTSIPHELKAFKWRIDAMAPDLSDWLSQYDFDAKASDNFGVGLMCDGKSTAGIILKPDQPWLSLLFHMIKTDMVEQKIENETAFYRLVADKLRVKELQE